MILSTSDVTAQPPISFLHLKAFALTSHVINEKTSFMSDNSLIQHSKKWDRTGIFVASLCLLHCLAFPLFITLLPASEFFGHNTWIESGVLIFGVIVGTISFFTSYRKHRMMGPMVIGFLGITLLFMSLFKGHDAHVAQISWTTIFGGLFLITGHMWNMRACACHCEKTCGHVHHESHS